MHIGAGCKVLVLARVPHLPDTLHGLAIVTSGNLDDVVAVVVATESRVQLQRGEIAVITPRVIGLHNICTNSPCLFEHLLHRRRTNVDLDFAVVVNRVRIEVCIGRRELGGGDKCAPSLRGHAAKFRVVDHRIVIAEEKYIGAGSKQRNRDMGGFGEAVEYVRVMM